MEFTLSQAAKEARVSKSTLSKALSTGRMSAERLHDGSFRIEASELFRVFPRKQGETETRTVPEQERTPSEPPDADLALMRLRVQMLEDQLSRERELRDQERETSQETVTDLRKRLDRAEERVLALEAKPTEASSATMQSTDPVTAVEPITFSAPVVPKPRGSLLARMFGRS